MTRRQFARRGASLATALLPGEAMAAAPIPPSPLLFDFSTLDACRGWTATHDLTAVGPAPDKTGLRIAARAGDPYTIGPPVAVPVNTPLWLHLRLRTDAPGGTWQMFYFPADGGASEEASVRFPLRAGEHGWQEVRVPLPAFVSSPYRFRIDPPGEVASVSTVAFLTVESRVVPTEPKAWPAPDLLLPAPPPLIVRAGALELETTGQTGGFVLYVGNMPFARGHDRPLVGYQATPDAALTWLDPHLTTHRETALARGNGGEIARTSRWADAEGATWTFVESFAPAISGDDTFSDAIGATCTLRVSKDRWISYFPWLTLLPGIGTFGSEKDQALLAGVEYLEGRDESSSTADIETPEHSRQVPDRAKLTLPLMAVGAHDRWAAIAWEPSPDIAAGFESPARRIVQNCHWLALLFPGAEGEQTRTPGDLLPSAARRLRANETITVRATILGGRGAATDAVRAWVARNGLPPLPRIEGDAQTRQLLTAGWTRSRLREGDQFRHAYPGSFTAHPAADAAACLAWLKQDYREARDAVPPGERGGATVGHVRTPAPLLAFGDLKIGLEQARQEGRAALGRFAPDGTVAYTPGKTDYGRTHGAKQANGITGPALATVLAAATLTGDRELKREGIARLRQANALYGPNSVPRGAQTWEVPLHTPDILASAYLVRAYVLGYELSGDASFLNLARRWAWTGVPFVYLVSPVPDPVGLYATTPVLGATNWVAPNWIGLPVQWCGLVYADALFDLAAHEPQEGERALWTQLANGIVTSGIQQTWPVGLNAERQGLLPDSFNLPGQSRNDVAINPATLQIPYARSLDRPLYTRWANGNGVILHAPGAIRNVHIEMGSLRFTVADAWPDGEYAVVVTGIAPANVRTAQSSGKEIPVERSADADRIVLRVSGSAQIAITLADSSRSGN